MEKITGFLLFALILIGRPLAQAQNSYTLMGSARSNSSSDCYQLTPALDGQTGAVWFDKRLRLTESFELTFLLNFGTNSGGSDGMAVVFQTQGKLILGGTGRGLGYKGLSPSLDIELDTNYNPEEGDIPEDHIALVSNGVTDHRLNKSFAPPVPISSAQKNIKDGRDHYGKIIWNAATHRLVIEVDCVKRIDQTVDLVNGIFTGVSEVYWGFTAATGSRNNAHTVCILNEQVRLDTIQACRDEQITLTSPLSFNGEYKWTPSTGLDNSRVRTPHLKVENSQLYTVQYLDRCAQPKLDSLFVKSKGVSFSIGNDRQICENDTITLKPNIVLPNVPVTYRWSTGQTTPQLNPTTSGQYSLTITAEGCSISDSTKVTFNPLPRSELSSTDSTYNCPGSQSIQFDPKAIGAGLQYSWTPGGSNAPELTAEAPGIYIVRVTTNMGCSSIQRFVILDNCLEGQFFVPDAFTPNGDGINDLLKWYGGSNMEARIKVFDRWGGIVFASKANSLYWDGTYEGKPCQPDFYTWSLEYWPRLALNTRTFFLRGKVLLLKYDK